MQEDMGPFSGEKFYTKHKHLKESDIIFVISSKKLAGEYMPYLEGKFKVDTVRNGAYQKGNRTFKYEADLSEIIRPSKPVGLSTLRDQKGRKKFADRFMGSAKPELTGNEIQEFEALIYKYADQARGYSEEEDRLPFDLMGITESDTERSQEILARVGQGKFKRAVAKVWGVNKLACAVTLIEIPQIIIASHIVPWRECVGEDSSMRWDGANGLLLCSHIDRLFDQYYLSFARVDKKECVICYSKTIPQSAMSQLGLVKNLPLVPNCMKSDDRERFFSYMSRHYEKFLELESARS
ncbi:MAG: hypothetical protein GVY22_09790 [Gammaproteobacteria bacterium]|jgi:hypothetical protein|nr:hypothetical protein [Gammaproteobacteria bacterium]